MDAVTAAVQAQREMAAFPWPEGERVRVRIGIHTGDPRAYEGGYVGMDVHRCARMAGAAHGGQIVISDATARPLKRRSPEGVTLHDLGLHQLKDLPELERLYQVEAEGLLASFPPLRSLGAVSRLPIPTTPLLGLQAELAELAALLGRGGARLVTLTGVGGSGKTRLALELARARVDDFPDGVHFVPLAEAHTAEQMWNAIAENLGVPPGANQVLARLTHLRALLVVDNLEQLTGADSVVTRILRAAGQLTLVATSRRPLHLSMEQELPVAPLGMPSDDSLEAAQAAPAIQLFERQARRVRPDFELTSANAADVVAVCRGLDGLPLAIEIAGARVTVLTPRALLVRLDTALDMLATVHDVTDRQRTLRATIAWSYDLLTHELKTAFARLGVFDGGGDLPAVAAVIHDESDPFGLDPLELVSALSDASMVTITENHDGEPRVALLETVRAFAVDQLVATSELDAVRALHAQHYLGVVEALRPQLHGDQFWRAREALDSEQNNLRAALRWCLKMEHASDPILDRFKLAVELCAGLSYYWDAGAKYAEARGWLEPVMAQAGTRRSPELGRCLTFLATSLTRLGEPEQARYRGLEAVQVLRDVGNEGYELAQALLALAAASMECRGADAARPLFEEAVEVARQSVHPHHIVDNLAKFESFEHNYYRSLDLHDEAIAMAHADGDVTMEGVYRHNRACVLRLMGRVGEARDEMVKLIPAVFRDMMPSELIAMAEDYGAVLADHGRHQDAVQLLGAADVLRERNGIPRAVSQQVEMHDAFASSERHLSERDWHDNYQRGRSSTLDALLGAHVPDEGPRLPA